MKKMNVAHDREILEENLLQMGFYRVLKKKSLNTFVNEKLVWGF